MKPLVAFASRFGGEIGLNPAFVVERSQRYFLLNPNLRKIARGDFFYAGFYLGKVKNGVFFPSFNLLNMLVPVAANKIVLEPKAAWLFICGRDVLRKGVAKFMGSQKRGNFTLVMNQFGECLGFGRIVGNLDSVGDGVVVSNVLDVGDFLRREF